jgi:hypothetical protein
MGTRSQAQVIVCERTGKWARAIAPHLPASARLQEVRGLAACTVELAAASASLIAVELQPDRLPQLWLFLAELPRRFPRARAVVLASDALAPLEANVREAGAVHWVESTRRAEEVGRLAARHLTRFAPDRDGIQGEIWQRLPWDPAACSA